MSVIADLQLHSKYARAVSQYMVLPEIAKWSRLKGIQLIATGDWTHPLWLREIKAHLEETQPGLFTLKKEFADDFSSSGNNPYFLLETEVSSIYSQGGKLRRIHNLIWSPSIASVDKINAELTKRGCNLMSDGRPIIGISSRDLAEIVFSIDPTCLIIPAHAWTPWFSLYGSESGFNSIDECFGEYAKYIYAIETGLSSDPAMNWRIKELDNRRIVSFSDAHSGPKLGREATVFRLKSPFATLRRDEEMKKLTYDEIRKVIVGDPSGEWEIGYSVEFYPEEGKYHYTGHRNCSVKQTPAETAKRGVVCPVCGRKLTVGVMHRVEELAGRSIESLKLTTKELGKGKVRAFASGLFPQRPTYVMLVPLQEIISESMHVAPTSQKVQAEYRKLVDALGGEFSVLINTEPKEIEKLSGPHIADAIGRVRKGDIVVDPGYDGVFGKVKIWPEGEEATKVDEKEQLSLF